MNTKFLLAGVSAIAIAAAASSANAASHKVAEQIDALSKKVEGMSDSFAKKGVKGASLTVSGQVNRAVLYLDDSNNAVITNVDSDASSTRFRWKASAPMSNGMKVGALLEIENGSNRLSSKGVDNNDASDDGVDRQTLTDSNGDTVTVNQAERFLRARHMDVWISGGFGKLSMGQGSTASDGVLHANFMHAGTADVNFEPLAGIGTTGGKTFGDGDREDRVRYDTPSFGGAKLGISYGNEGHVQATARYAGKVGGAVRLDARISYEAADQDTDIIAGSAGINVSGFQFTVAAAHNDGGNGGNEDFFYGLQAGYTGKLTSMGNTGFAAQFIQRSSTVKTIGLGVTQDLAPGTTAYASLRFSDRQANGTEDTAALVGMRVRF